MYKYNIGPVLVMQNYKLFYKNYEKPEHLCQIGEDYFNFSVFCRNVTV